MIVPALSRSVAARVVSAVLLAAPAVMAAQPVPPPAQRTPMARLLIDEPRVQLGVTVRDIDPADNKQAGQSGALITSVQPGSAAAAAGLQTSDLVVEFDGERVRSARQFARLVQETPPGRAVNASLLRDGRKQQVSLTLVREPRTRAFNDRDRLLPRFDVDRAAP